MTRLLVDTHIFLWMQTAPERLGAATELLEGAQTVIYLSAASSWEISIKWSLGKLPLPESPTTYISDRMRRGSVVGLSVEHRHAVAVAEMPLHHRDPFDRLLIAQAIVERMPLVTADPSMDPYAVELIRVAADSGLSSVIGARFRVLSRHSLRAAGVRRRSSTGVFDGSERRGHHHRRCRGGGSG